MEVTNIISDEEGIRADIYISQKLTGLSRSYIQKLIKSELIKINDKIITSKYNIKKGDSINIAIPCKKESSINAENIELDIVYEDKYIIIVNKPKGMVVHPAPGSEQGTLVNALLNYTKDLSDINIERAGIVHRIDKDTTGLIICAKNNDVHLKLIEMFINREISKNYLAICYGRLKDGSVNAPIGRDQKDRKKMTVTLKNSKEALTDYRCIASTEKYSIADIKIHTGRTHQIRVHMKYINYPIVGDPVYGLRSEKNKTGQFLHAYRLKFRHPIIDKIIDIKALPNTEFLEKVKKIGLENEFREFINSI